MPDIQAQTPDGITHTFPDGTKPEVIDKVIKNYLASKKGATVSPAPKPAPTPQPQSTAPKEPTFFQNADKSIEELQGQIARARPRWDNPQAIMQDPHWYGRSARYLGGEAIGTGKAVSGVVTGGTKTLNDLIASIDPIELYKRPQGEPAAQLTKDVVDMGKGFIDLGKASYDLIRHFPESSADPEQFGQTVMNIAMTVDGGLKGAKAVSEHLGFTPTEAVAMAKKLSKSTADGFLRTKATEDAYVHKNGVATAQKIVDATKSAHAEVKAHVDNLTSQIPKTDGIDAYKAAQDVIKAHSDLVQTPDPMNPVLSQLVKEAAKISPAKMPFEEARQFRSKVGMALRNAKGANTAVLSRAYGDLTGQLKGLSSRYGLVDSWNHYNELEAKMQKSFPIIDAAQDIIDNNGEGAKMASALKDKAPTQEVINSLEKYGLDGKKVLDYSKKANKAISNKMSFNKSMFRQVYGFPGGAVGLPVAIATRMVVGGGPEGYAAGIGAGSLAGAATTYLVHAIRAARLSADTLDTILESREFPGKMKLPKAKMPPSPMKALPEAPIAPSPPSAPTEPPLPTPTAKAAELPKPSSQEIEDIRKSTGLPLTEEAVARRIHERTDLPQKLETKPAAAKTEPKVTKLPPEAGSRATKQRERVAKVRAEKGSTAYGGGTQEISGGGVATEELKKAEARINRPDIDVSKMETVDLERQLQSLDSKKFKEAISLRKEHQMTSDEYKAVLEFYFTEAMEDKIRESDE